MRYARFLTLIPFLMRIKVIWQQHTYVLEKHPSGLDFAIKGVVDDFGTFLRPIRTPGRLFFWNFFSWTCRGGLTVEARGQFEKNFSQKFSGRMLQSWQTWHFLRPIWPIFLIFFWKFFFTYAELQPSCSGARRVQVPSIRTQGAVDQFTNWCFADFGISQNHFSKMTKKHPKKPLWVRFLLNLTTKN